MSEPRFDAADLRARLLARGPGVLEHDAGDHVLNPDWEQLAEGASTREAAVLVPVVDRPGEAGVVLTTRAAHLRKHSGQIAFPGGSVDPADASPEAAALREAREEVGLDPASVEVLGRLPRYRTTTGFRITPVIGIVPPDFVPRPDPAEVADAFEVPLGFLMNAANHARDSRVWQGRPRYFYTMPFGDRYIWGVTAGILRTLYERLYAS
ncbi:CoA pyrophosphatase [Aureimonas flava]|uniref:CoA pyrophosphatase n=1 Tax=Aureimonas flava TaxID=2320271 RepID=A0A3A1WLC6_9HYPH|nr:CoA pyrophosphatase [Aureimonas flava]RIY02109.1 CoA pyrophosphatase [Aureimonas flava]